MAKIAKNLIFILIVFVVIVAILGTFGVFMIYQVYADDYSPLDFSSDYHKFETRVGFDENGRYLTYHYEFNE
jgi:hypothetical protein